MLGKRPWKICRRMPFKMNLTCQMNLRHPIQPILHMEPGLAWNQTMLFPSFLYKLGMEDSGSTCVSGVQAVESKRS